MNSGWISCTEGDNPNIARGSGHWIMYDFNEEHHLVDLHIWNLNDFSLLSNGIKKYSIDASSDGKSWIELGVYNLDMANGSTYYLGQAGPVLENVQARYVLITAIENYGGSCYGLSEIKFNISESSLPVTLIHQYVTCNKSGNGNIISWSTENENNNDGFLIFKSYDGKEWTQLGYVKGRNNQSRVLYTYEDKNTVGESYYQIRQQDLNGHLTYFDFIKSTCDKVESSLNIVQNPVDNILYFTFQRSGNRSYEINIADISGKIVYHDKTINDGLQSRQVQIDDLPAGSYILFVKDGEVNLHKKFQKL